MASEPLRGPPSCSLELMAHLGIFNGQHLIESTTALLLVQMCFILIISQVLQVLLKPLGQPRMISDMIAGFIVGPSLLGGYDQFNSLVFPEKGTLMIKVVSEMGTMLFFFVTGVQMDFSLITKPGKRSHLIATSSVLLPVISVLVGAFYIRKSFSRDIKEQKYALIGVLAASLSTNSANVLYTILKELNLLNADVGRLALSICVIVEFVGWITATLLGVLKQTTLYRQGLYLGSFTGFLVILLAVIRPAAMWINRRTPVGQKVDRFYVVIFFVGIFVSGFVTDMLGATMIQGPLILGFILPEGPPLGATLVERIEVIMNTIFMPIFFAQIGLDADIASMKDNLDVLLPLVFLVLVGYVTKFVGTMLPSVCFGMPFRDAISLSLLLGCRGQSELIIFLHWRQHLKIIKTPGYTMLVLCTMSGTSVLVPLIRMIYVPTRSYMTTKRRTILHSKSNSTFNVVACVHHQESIPAAIDLIKASNPTHQCPIAVYVIHLVKLVGRSASVFTSHQCTNFTSKPSSSDTIWKALKMYKRSVCDFVTFHLFTAVAPYKTMHHEICKLALEKKASLIILPINRSSSKRLSSLSSWGGSSSLSPWGVETYNASYTVNSNVLSYAPCSVGILVDRNPNRNLAPSSSFRQSSYNVVVLYLGGADAREALAYADKMADEGGVSLTIAQFLPVGDDVEDGDGLIDKQLDEQLMEWFVSKHLDNDQIEYTEIKVRHGAETINAIQELNKNQSYDLWIVGRQKGVNPVLVDGISAWCENHQLGVIGEFISSSDFRGTASVLVIQQQVMMQKIKGKWTYSDA